MYVRLNSSNPDVEPWRVERLHYAQDYHRKCAYCGGQMKRNDLAVIVTEPYPPASDSPGELRKARRTKVYHRACWFAEQGRPDWYYPGALAEAGVGLEETDPAAKEDMPVSVEGVQVPLEHMAEEPMVELPGALPPPTPSEPVTREPAGEAQEATPVAETVAAVPEEPGAPAAPHQEELSWRKTPWKKFMAGPETDEMEPLRRLWRAFMAGPPPKRSKNPMGRQRRNPRRTPEKPEVAIYTGSSGGGAYTGSPERATMGTPVYYREQQRKGMNGLVFLVLILALGGAAFAGYWFLVRAKYTVGQMLQHIVDANTTVNYQITALKYSGLTHEYVMTNQTTQQSETFSVSSVDNDTAHWIPAS